jgi:hypothetical protein
MYRFEMHDVSRVVADRLHVMCHEHVYSRAWYKRAESAPSKTSISTAYMDAAGVGKIITISQALFEGMTPRTRQDCQKLSKSGPLPGGCACTKDEDCIIGLFNWMLIVCVR